MTDEEFYRRCGEILGVEHTGKAFAHYARTRWNNRTPGRGRYPGRGIVRLFGNTVHIALTNPPCSKTIKGRQAALDHINVMLQEARNAHA